MNIQSLWNTIVLIPVCLLVSLMASPNHGLELRAEESDFKQEEPLPFEMPRRGICAHRGASGSMPENTIPAIQEAVRLGAHMIEFDLALSSDGHVVLMHDSTLDRTTNGSGRVDDYTLAELKEFDAGSWKDQKFKGLQIPTFQEVLAVVPENIWLNVHLKGGGELARKATEEIRQADCFHQAFLACSLASAQAAREVDSRIKICNMDRQSNSREYVEMTIGADCEFIQLTGEKRVRPEIRDLLKSNGVHINFFGTNDPAVFARLIKDGAEFPLVDNVTAMMPHARELGIEPLQPIYRSEVPAFSMTSEYAQMLATHQFDKARATQGLALTKDRYYSSTGTTISKFDPEWNLLQEKAIKIEGVNHIGAIDYHEGAIWAGFLHGPEGGKHDPKMNRSIIARIDAETLEVAKTWDITKDVSWIDPVCVDGPFIYVGDLSDLGIHRYRFEEGRLVRDAVFRYPRSMHFSQGIRIRQGKLYSIHTFGEADGLFEFELPETISEKMNQPTRVWPIQETGLHLEGFAFVPGTSNEIWHAQAKQVDRYRLIGLESDQ